MHIQHCKLDKFKSDQLLFFYIMKELKSMIWNTVTLVLAINVAVISGLQKDLQGVYWEIKPFVFTENGETKGMIIEYFNQLRTYCLSKQQVMNLQSKLLNHQKFVSLLNDLRKEYKQTPRLVNVTKQKAAWFPMVTIPNETVTDKRKLQHDILFYSPKVAVVVKREKILLQYKLSVGIINCKHLLVIALILAVFFAISIWMAVSIVFRFYAVISNSFVAIVKIKFMKMFIKNVLFFSHKNFYVE